MEAATAERPASRRLLVAAGVGAEGDDRPLEGAAGDRASHRGWAHVRGAGRGVVHERVLVHRRAGLAGAVNALRRIDKVLAVGSWLTAAVLVVMLLLGPAV